MYVYMYGYEYMYLYVYAYTCMIICMCIGIGIETGTGICICVYTYIMHMHLRFLCECAYTRMCTHSMTGTPYQSFRAMCKLRRTTVSLTGLLSSLDRDLETATQMQTAPERFWILRFNMTPKRLAKKAKQHSSSSPTCFAVYCGGMPMGTGWFKCVPLCVLLSPRRD